MIDFNMGIVIAYYNLSAAYLIFLNNQYYIRYK